MAVELCLLGYCCSFQGILLVWAALSCHFLVALQGLLAPQTPGGAFDPASCPTCTAPLDQLSEQHPAPGAKGDGKRARFAPAKSGS